MEQVSEVQTYAYGIMVYAWDYTGGSVKREVKRFAKEVILDNADDIEKSVKEFAKTTAFSAVINAVSQKLVSEIGPVAMDAFSKSDIAKSIVDIQKLSFNLVESIDMIVESNARGDDSNVLLNQKLAEISMQLEYLRVNQPTQFMEIMNYVQISTLTDVLAKLTGTLSSSSTRRRIENI